MLVSWLKSWIAHTTENGAVVDQKFSHTMPDREQRLCPRVKYSAGSEPVVHLGKRIFKVVDLSKTGVKFHLPESESIGQRMVEGTIRIFDGTCIRFKGEQVRQDDDTSVVVVQFLQTEYLLE